MKIISSELYVKDNKVYHEGNKPKPKDIGAAPETHTHNYASATTPGGSAEHAIKATEDSLGQRIDKYIKGLSVSGRTITYTRGDGTTGTITTQDNDTDTKVTNTLNTTAKAYITGTTDSATNTGTQVFDTNVYLDTTAGMLTATTFKGALQGNAATATSATSATSATKLATARTINGTSFDGTGNITTANWGTARNIQIGNSSKSVNGSSNMTWTLAEIGAAPDGHTHSYLPLTGGTMTGVVTSSINTGTYLEGNKGKSIINSTNTAGGYTALIKSNSTNGYFTQATYQGNHLLQYTAKSTVDAGTNGITKSAVLLNESGNTSFPGTVTAPTFSGALSGNATSSTSASHAAKLTTPRSINGTNFDGTAAITTANWGTARTLTIGNTGKSVDGSGNVSWSIGEIGAAPTVHNHTSLTGITNLSFAAEGSDSASITTTVDGSSTYFDFNLSDDPSQNDMWRWRFRPHGGNLFNAMTLDAISTTEAKLAVTGEVQATRLKGTLTGDVKGNVTGTVSGNAGSATKLATARTINGTNFDGTENITTANWGTARNIQIGNAVKSVNGSGNVTWTLAEIGALPLSGGTVKGSTIFQQGTRVHNGTGTHGSSGYVKIAQLKITSNYQNQPIYFLVSQRGRDLSTLEVYFSSINGPDPALSKFYKTGGVVAYLHKSATSVWDLYIQKSEGYDNIDILDFRKGSYMNGTTVTWTDVHVDSVPSGAVAATAKTEAIHISGNASTATKLQTSRTINGTNFDGTGNITTANWGTARNIQIGNTAKSVNGSANVTWSLSEIGAAASNHTHSYLPLSGGTLTSSIKFSGGGYNNHAIRMEAGDANGAFIGIGAGGLTVIGSGESTNAVRTALTNGADETMIVASDQTIRFLTGLQNGYDSAKEVSINAAGVINAPQGMTGNASTATKLQTARSINGTNFDGTGNITTANWGTARNLNGVSVNGSTNYTIPVENYYCNVNDNNTNLYHRILTTDIATGNWVDKSLIIVMHSGYYSGGFGIAKIAFRTNDISSTANSQAEIKWLVRNGFHENALVFNFINQAKNACMDVFYKSPGTYAGMTWYVLSEGGRGGAHSKQWTKYNTNASGTNAYTEANMKTLRTYTSTLVSATDAGHVSTASTLSTARTINGTSFNGSANITTANWGTARNLQIGNTAKSVNGSGNVSWTLSEIGAAASNHTHSYLPLSGGTLTGNLTTNGVIYGKNNIALDRGTLWIQGAGGNTTCDYLRFGTNILASNDSKQVYLMDTSGNRAHLDMGDLNAFSIKLTNGAYPSLKFSNNVRIEYDVAGDSLYVAGTKAQSGGLRDFKATQCHSTVNAVIAGKKLFIQSGTPSGVATGDVWIQV